VVETPRQVVFIQLEFKKSAKACKKKFQNMYAEDMKTKGGNKGFGNGVYLCKFYEDFD
jgi:hypothetical protein